MQQQLTRLRTGFTGLPRRAQILILAVAVVAVFIMFMSMRGVMSTNWATVPTDNLKPEQAAKATAALDEAGIQNQLTSGATMVEVPVDDVSQATATLAQAQVAGVGTHTTCEQAAESSKSYVAATTAQQDARARVCLQNELANVVESFPGVKSATVNLKDPPTRLFSDEQQPSGASIMITMEGSTRLDKEQIQAIQAYVANAVDQVKPEAVTITDGEGLLSGAESVTGGKDETVSAQTLKLTVQQMRNDQIEAQLTQSLEKIAGDGKVVVESNVELDMDKVTREVKDYGGADNQKGPASAVDSKFEQLAGSGTVNGGPTGTASNVGADAEDQRLAAEDTTGEASGDYVLDAQKVTFNNDEVAEAIAVAPGAEKRNRVFVTVDSSVPQSAQNAIKDNTQAFLGGNAQDALAFNVAPLAKEGSGSKGAAAARRDMIAGYLKWFVAGIGLLAMAFLLRRQLNQRTEELLFPIEDPYELEAGNFEPIPLAELEAAVAAATSLDNQKRLELQRKVEQIAQDKPQEVANQLRGWLQEETDQYGYATGGRR